MAGKRQSKVSTSDRDVLKPRRPAPDSTADDDYLPADLAGVELGDTETTIIRAMGHVFTDLQTGRIQKDTADPMISAARVTLNAVKSRDTKTKIALLERMLQDAQAVANAGLKREAEDRHHVTNDAKVKPADAGGGNGDD